MPDHTETETDLPEVEHTEECIDHQTDRPLTTGDPMFNHGPCKGECMHDPDGTRVDAQ